MLPGVGFFVLRPPARRYHYEALGGLVLGGAAFVAYRPAPARRYAHAATGGLLLGGAATVVYRQAGAHEVVVTGAALAIVDGDLVVLVPRIEDHLLIFIGDDEGARWL